MDKGKMSERPNCYDCKHRGEVPGSAHSRCKHPLAFEAGADKLNVSGNSIGIRRGWFNWPFDYDSNFLLSCDGFDKSS